MAHLEKFHTQQLKKMLGHYDRSNANISNPGVDREKSHLNYNLAPDREMSQFEFVEKRCSEVRCFGRSDVVKVCDWIVTAPKTLPTEKLEDFFRETYNFLEDKYGRDNTVSAYVHMDETTPHIHFAFVPVVRDKKKGDLKVSAKEAVTRSDLKFFHSKLQNHLELTLKVKVDILNDATKDGNLAMEDYKRLMASKDYEKAKQLIEEAPERAREIIEAAENKAKAIEAEYAAKKEFLEGAGDFNLIEGVKEIKTITGKTKSYEVPAAVWETQTISQMGKSAQEAMTRAAEKQFTGYKDLQEENVQLKKENRELKAENSKLKQMIDKLKELIKDTPKRIREAAKLIFRGSEDKSPSQDENALKTQNRSLWNEMMK